MFGGTTMRNTGGACALILAMLMTASCKGGPGSAGLTPQGWTSDVQTKWYTYSQGSRLLPLAWAKALEQADSTALFLDPAHINRLGYIYLAGGRPGDLPIGFTVDDTPDARLSNTAFHWKAGQGAGTSATDKVEPWLGLNCSACHTAELTYQGKVMRVDGGPALSDFQQFLVDLRASLSQTASDPAKFDRFAKRVLAGADDTPANRQMLMTALKTLSAHENALGAINATDLKYGYGRLDAFGHIFSKVAFAAAGPAARPQPSDAPTSYPFLWGIPYEDRIQWNGIAKNLPSVGVNKFDAGALARNSGEVVGVFADLHLTDQPQHGYTSSANIDNLVWFEQQLEALRAPPWPGEAVFGDKGKIDAALAAEGKTLFGTDNTDKSRTTCATCHEVVPSDDQTRKVKVRMSLFLDPDAPGTDPTMACNAFMRKGPAGVLKGTPSLVLVGDPLGAEPPLADLLKTSVAGLLLNQGQKVASVAVASAFGYNRPVPPPVQPSLVPLTPREQMLQTCMATKSDILGYKGRPLNGIWATAPYLHNGSVQNLAELLNPAKRAQVFWVGNREYDPVNLGYVSTENVGSKFDTSLPGNSNKGHDYGTSALTDHQRKALLEYLKTL
jgi:cytochrome c553